MLTRRKFETWLKPAKNVIFISAQLLYFMIIYLPSNGILQNNTVTVFFKWENHG